VDADADREPAFQFEADPDPQHYSPVISELLTTSNLSSSASG
jgi:hypothetical protein